MVIDSIETVIKPAHEPQTICLARDLLQQEQIVAFPTDTVYGVGAYSYSESAVTALYTVKERSRSKAIPLLIAAPDDLRQVASTIHPDAWQLAERFWPGALTIILPKSDRIPLTVTAGGNTVAVRCPNHPIPLALIEAIGAPIAATSANLSGAPSPTTAQQVLSQLDGRIPLIVDGGTCPAGTPSTLVDLSCEPPRLLRLGNISAEEIRCLLPQLVMACNT